MYRDTRRTGARSTYTTYYYTVNTYRVGFTIFTCSYIEQHENISFYYYAVHIDSSRVFK